MKRVPAFAAFALALLAASVFIFQPICAADEVHLSDDAESVCLSIGPAAPAQSASAAILEDPRPTISGAAAGSRVAGVHIFFCGAVASAVPLPVPRYHARSARIQR